ncbi:hypothetical protein CA850_10185 [Micromonospora echinospora]|uniref:Uncharacterized protein n=1 Tax=Micromonospora echinospora TaxID=1877 RepID=A0A1C4ZMD9_MICEC|nr:hypothetical protein [Micromonospora echinospora]OZV81539.1 hypothetical protein CA850_10185 [Micromonospora echinospora]SCF33944.1 hypothetical protein GA0070618_5460 [Micromonospora echinospora]
MQSFAGTFARNLVVAAVCTVAGPILLVLGAFGVADPGESDRRIPLVFLLVGLAGTLAIPVLALSGARADYRAVTRRDRLDDAPVRPDDSFALWAPRADVPTPQGRFTAADVLEAAFVRYGGDWEATYQSYGGDLDPDEVKPLIRLRLRIHPDDSAPFEWTGERRVPSLCLSAVTAGRLVAVVESTRPAEVRIDWPRSALLAGARPCRLIGLDGRRVDLTGRPDLLVEQIRIAGTVGGIRMDVDTIDLRNLAPPVATRLQGLVERVGEPAERPALQPTPDGRPRWVVDDLPGEAGAFGDVDRRWARHGGQLTRARFLELRGTTTYQYHGPVLETVLRIWPVEGGEPFDARKKLTVPMNYLALLHRTKDLVALVSPDRRRYEIDWNRSNLAAGVTPALVIAPDGREFDLTGRLDPLLAIMRLLVAHQVSVPDNVLDLRARRHEAVAAQVMEALRTNLDRGATGAGPR